ncbi:MAG: AmmeMemoRadiSam system radical SAM enzyme [Thermoplasmata archaeon]
MKEAMFYSPQEGNKVLCRLCRHGCQISEGRRGICEVRENRGGKLYSLVYRKAISIAIDPIEKKPLFHFHPGSVSLSMATAGCNFRCQHCQNYTISQLVRNHGEIPGKDVSPEEIVRMAKEEGCDSISYTYSEPTIFFEYAYDVAKIAKREGIANNFVTNGYIGEDPLREISPYLDAANIDLKGFSDDFYRKVCGARLQPVLDSIGLHHELGIWIEITTLLIPGYNDSKEELEGIAKFIASVDPAIPWHVSRFHPDYRMRNVPATPIGTLRLARDIGMKAGLKYVYEGNVPGEEREDTFCPSCGELLIKRYGFSVMKNVIEDSKCPKCGTKIEGRFQ